ncbi:hypothetical protein SAMN05216428_11582 [Nitrosospira sp. Nsp11]|nr:hypothetical protein SAMN05216428_11582 [Nitrosospira sp. Nsp11]
MQDRFQSRMNVYPPQVPLAEIGRRFVGDAYGVCFRSVPSGIGVQARCGRKHLRIKGHDRRSEPRQRLAWPVTAISGKNRIFAGAKIYPALGGERNPVY